MGRMTPAPQASGRAPRRVALNIILLVVFLASVGVAWWLTRRPAPGAGLGEAIVAQIHRDGLGAYWTSGRLDWYLYTDSSSGRPIGWGASTVAPRSGGRFDGLRLSVSIARKGGAMRAWERWRLDNDAAAGQYTAGMFDGPAGQVRTREDTSIHLAAGKVTVRQEIDGIERHSSSDAPPNYLPEGTLALARKLVAMRKGRGRFASIFNTVPPAGQKTTFSTITYQYAPPSRSDPDIVAARVQVRRIFPDRKSTELHLLDASGWTVAVIYGSIKQLRVDGETVAVIFPHAASQLRQVMVATQMPFSRAR